MIRAERDSATLTRRWLIRLAGLAGTSAIVAGCQTPAAAPSPGSSTSGAGAAAKPATTSPSPAAARSPATAAAGATGKTKLRYGMLKFAAASVQNPFYYMAQEKGFFAEQGLDVEFVEIIGGATMVQGVASKDLQIALGDAAVLPAVAEGANLVIVGSLLPVSVFTMFARKDRGIESLKDLAGKTVGTSGPGSIFEVLTTAMMKKQGLDPSQVSMANIGTSVDIWNALQAGKIDASLSNYEFIAGVEKTAVKLVPDGDAAQALPDYLFQNIFIHGDSLKQSADVMTKMLVAMAKGIRYTIEHPDEALVLASKASGKSSAEAKPPLDVFLTKKVYAPNLDFTPAQIEYTQRVNIDVGQQKTLLPFDKVATLDLQKRVVETLGPYKY